MGLDARLKRQLEEARQNILEQLYQNEAPGGRKAGIDFRPVDAELRDELRQINELLGPEEAAEECERPNLATPGDQPTATFETKLGTPASERPSAWSLRRGAALAAGISIGVASGAATHNDILGIGVGIVLGAAFVKLA